VARSAKEDAREKLAIMRDTSSIASAAPSSSGTRPDWVRQTRSATAFWMPTVVVLALTLLLVLLWPHKRRHAAGANSMPEAAASYVLLEGSYLALPGNPLLGNSWLGPRSSTLPEHEEAVVRRLPLPEYTGLGAVDPWAPMPRRTPSNAIPDLATRPVAAVLTGLPPGSNSLAMTLSPGLQRCGFHFEVSPGLTTGLPAVARFYVELDNHGDVIHLLAESAENPASHRLLETAISRGHGTRAGSGEVTVSR